MVFKKVKLGEISIITMGQSPKSEFYSEIDGTPFLQGNRTFQHIYPVIDTYTKKVTKLANANDILFSVRAPVGDINIAPVDLCIGRGLCAIRSINNNQEFLFYLLKSKINELESQATGTIFSSVNKKTLENFIVNIPNEKQQKNIGTILSNLDKKIELNQKIIANLEDLSQTLFERWFVDFEFPDENGNPYKSSGGEMVDSELGEIPKKWYIKSINEITSRVRTGLNPRKNFVLGDGQNYYVTIKNMSNNNIYLNEKCDRINDEALKIINKRSDLKKNDILFSGIGTIGRVYLVAEKPENWNISESIFTLRPSDSLYSYYLYQLMLSENVQNYVQQLSSGSVQKGIRKADLIKFKLPISKNNFIENLYSNKIKNFTLEIQNLRKENLKLVKLRDTLLPKLMSGEIEIPDDIEVNEDELSI